MTDVTAAAANTHTATTQQLNVKTSFYGAGPSSAFYTSQWSQLALPLSFM